MAVTLEPATTGVWLNTRQVTPLLCGVTDRTVRNCIRVGTRTPAGVVRLQAVTVGGRYYTRPEWVTEYLAAVAVPVGGVEPAAEHPTARDRRFADERERLSRRLNPHREPALSEWQGG